MMVNLLGAAKATSPAEGYAIMALAGAGWLLWYAFACWRWPFRSCPKCKGLGRIHAPSGKTFRMCKWCGGSARRLRAARRIYNYFHARKDAS